jgi:hypothetical protein
MSTLKFARELALFEEHLDWLRMGGDEFRGPGNALAASYKALIDGLIELDEHLDSAGPGADVPRIPDILARAIAVFHEEEAQSRQCREKRREVEEAEYAEAAREHEEAVRRHDLAITVECPYCGAQPGKVCLTAGPAGVGHPKGIHDHKQRRRAAAEPEGSTQVASGQGSGGPPTRGRLNRLLAVPATVGEPPPGTWVPQLRGAIADEFAV